MEQITLKQSISKNRAHQHASRLNAIKITIEKENAEYNGGGLGMNYNQIKQMLTNNNHHNFFKFSRFY